VRAPGGALPAGIAVIVAQYAGVVLDIDGVLTRGTEPIPGAPEAVKAMRAAGVGVAFATNNAARTPVQVVKMLAGAGIEAAPSEVVTSALAAARLLDRGTRCLVIGMDGVREALALQGCVEVREPGQAEAVVVGFDRHLVWDDLRRATLALRAGARFMATNGDATFPSPEGLWPGNGAIVSALVTASDRTPEFAGKPHPPLYEAAAAVLPPGPLLMVGDRVDTDIAGAAALGWDTALVLTGVTAQEAAHTADPAPTHLVESLAALV
jgi:HAD superfamily hydrolase (TIGR01457 family)